MAVRRVFRFQVTGHKELQKTLEALPKAIADQVLRTALKKAMQPVADAAQSLAPRDDGDLANSITVSTRLKRGQRERLQKGVVAMYAGPAGRKGAHGHLVEFGSGARYHKSGKSVGIMPAKPFLRPAWDANSQRALQIMRDELWTALRNAVRRLRGRSERGKLSASQARAFIR